MSNEQAHTSEPWFVFGNGHCIGGPLTDRLPAETQTAGIAMCSMRMRMPEENGANARRIVAAVNACAAVPTEVLERVTWVELVLALGLCEQLIDQVGLIDPDFHKVDAGKRQLDDLFARLKAPTTDDREREGRVETAGEPAPRNPAAFAKGDIIHGYGARYEVVSVIGGMARLRNTETNGVELFNAHNNAAFRLEVGGCAGCGAKFLTTEAAHEHECSVVPGHSC